jgi:hypothetical protein
MVHVVLWTATLMPFKVSQQAESRSGCQLIDVLKETGSLGKENSVFLHEGGVGIDTNCISLVM